MKQFNDFMVKHLIPVVKQSLLLMLLVIASSMGCRYKEIDIMVKHLIPLCILVFHFKTCVYCDTWTELTLILNVRQGVEKRWSSSHYRTWNEWKVD